MVENATHDIASIADGSYLKAKSLKHARTRTSTSTIASMIATDPCDTKATRSSAYPTEKSRGANWDRAVGATAYTGPRRRLSTETGRGFDRMRLIQMSDTLYNATRFTTTDVHPDISSSPFLTFSNEKLDALALTHVSTIPSFDAPG